MVFRRKRTVFASASHFLLPFVSSELGSKITISYLSVQQSKLSHPRCCGWPDALLPSAFGLVQQCHRVIHSTSGVIVLTDAQKGMK